MSAKNYYILNYSPSNAYNLEMVQNEIELLNEENLSLPCVLASFQWWYCNGKSPYVILLTS